MRISGAEIVIVAVLLLLLGVVAIAYFSAKTGESGQPPATAEEGPWLQISNRSLDVGILQPEERKEFTVTLRNIGKKMLTISKIDTHCECLLYDISDRYLTPDEEANLTFEFIAEKMPQDAFSFYIEIFSNSTIEPKLMITVTGSINPEYMKDPPVISFFQVLPGSEHKGEMTIRPREGYKFELSEPYVEGPLKDAIVTPLPDGAGYRVTATLVVPEKEQQSELNGIIGLKSTLKRVPYIVVPVSASVLTEQMQKFLGISAPAGATPTTPMKAATGALPE